MKSLPPLLALALLVGTPALARDRFLQDGGGIRTQRVVGSPYGPAVLEVPALGEGRPFLEDGGGIRFAPELPRIPNGEAYGGSRGSNRGSSVTEIPDGGRRGSGRNISVVVVNGNGAPAEEPAAPPAGYGGAKIIEVATARLDRRPFDASGRDVSYFGSTKVIRIAPPDAEPAPRDETLELDNGADLAGLAPAEEPAPIPVRPSRNETVPRNETAASPTPPIVPPVPSARPEQPAQTAVATGFEPWTADWLRDCVRRYPDFDASLGTYLDETGRRRFCTGEP